MESLSRDEQISLVSHQAAKDPKARKSCCFCSRMKRAGMLWKGIGDRTLFRIMKSQSSTHIGVLSLVNPERFNPYWIWIKSFFSTKGVTDPQKAYHWMVSFLEEGRCHFCRLLSRLDIRVVASAFQDKIVRPSVKSGEADEEEIAPSRRFHGQARQR